MIPAKVYFTGLELDPLPLITDRCIKGVIPQEWHRHRFTLPMDVSYPIPKLNRWLGDNITGRWAIYMMDDFNSYRRDVVIAFENGVDGVLFVLADGKAEAFHP